MNKVRRQTGRVRVECDVPDGWYWTEVAVPNLRIPQQLLAVSNRRIRLVSAESEQPRPNVSHLDDEALFFWCYYQHRDDVVDEQLPIPSYGSTMPKAWSVAEVFPDADAREWEPGQFRWQRVGVALDNGCAVTLWAWVAPGASDADQGRAADLLQSFTAAAA